MQNSASWIFALQYNVSLQCSRLNSLITLTLWSYAFTPLLFSFFFILLTLDSCLILYPLNFILVWSLKNLKIWFMCWSVPISHFQRYFVVLFIGMEISHCDFVPIFLKRELDNEWIILEKNRSEEIPFWQGKGWFQGRGGKIKE